MTFNFGINNQNSENSFTLGYTNKNYTERLSKLLGIEDFKTPMRVDLVFSRSSFFSKYALDFKNPFFFKLFNDKWTTDFEINSKTKKIKYVNYDILPSFKLTAKNTVIPISLYLKHANYRASAEQDFGAYDYSQLLKSLLPYERTSIGIKFEDVYNFKAKPEQPIADNNHNINQSPSRPKSNPIHENIESLVEPTFDGLLAYKLKLNLNRIKCYEDSLKLRATAKLFKHIPFTENFAFSVTNELSLKNSFIFNAKGDGKPVDSNSGLNSNIGTFNVSSSGEADSNVINPYHILSTNEAHSKILDLNINNIYREFNVGNKFCLTNHLQVKLKNISLLRQKTLFSYLCPFIGFETIFVPCFDKSFYSNASGAGNSHKGFLHLYKMLDYEESFRFVANAGLAVQINENISIDFTLKTYTKGFKIADASVFDKFRMNMNVSMNI